MSETKSPFRQRLEAAVAAKHSRMNPFTEKWVKGELTRAQFGAWASQHYQYVSQFARWCAAVYAECPDSDARDFLLENIIEEESGVKHVDLLIVFRSLRVSHQEVETAQRLPATRALTAWLRDLQRPFHVAAAGLLVGLESQVPASASATFRRSRPTTASRPRSSSSPSTSKRTRSTASAATRSSRAAGDPEKQEEAADQVRQATEMRWR